MSDAGFDIGELYQEVILDRGRHPRHQHRLEPFDGAAKGDNPMCGDRVEVRVRMDGDRIAQAGFEARGCAISIASADLMAEAVTGHTGAAVHDLAERFRAMVQTGECPDCRDIGGAAAAGRRARVQIAAEMRDTALGRPVGRPERT